MRQLGDIFVELLLQPKGGIDVARGGRGTHNAPVYAAHILPGEILAGVDLGGKRLSLFGRAGDHQSAVAGDLVRGSLGGGVVIPVLGAVGINGQAVAGGCQQYVASIVVQYIGAARNQANVGSAGGKGLTHSLIAGAHSDLHLAHVIAQAGKLGSEHFFQRLGGGDDLLRFAGGNKGDAELFDGFAARFTGDNGRRSSAAGSGRRGAAGCAGRTAAGQQASAHRACKEQGNRFFHVRSSCVFLFVADIL